MEQLTKFMSSLSMSDKRSDTEIFKKDHRIWVRASERTMGLSMQIRRWKLDDKLREISLRFPHSWQCEIIVKFYHVLNDTEWSQLGDEATVEFINVKSVERTAKASGKFEVDLTDKIAPMWVMKTDFMLDRGAKANDDRENVNHGSLFERQMKLFNSLFQLNETLIRWQAKCHIEVKCFIRKCLSCFFLPFFCPPFSSTFRFKIHEHWLSTQREKKFQDFSFHLFLDGAVVFAVCRTNCSDQ